MYGGFKIPFEMTYIHTLELLINNGASTSRTERGETQKQIYQEKQKYEHDEKQQNDMPKYLIP